MRQSHEFAYDVFLSHSARDKAVVRPLAERLRADGLKVWFDEWVLKPGDSILAKIEEGLEHSRVLVLCMSAQAFGSDWAQLEAGTFRFRDPLNQERRFIPLRLDDAPIKGSLAQFLYIKWRPVDREQEYAKLLAACRGEVLLSTTNEPPEITPAATSSIPQEFRSFVADKTRGFVGRAYVFSEIDSFLLHHPRGYFIIQGDPGAGKSAILAEYVRRHLCVAHFNIRAEGITSTQQFLDSVEGQLRSQFGISASSDSACKDGRTRLAKLLDSTREKLGANNKVVISVDALDEVDQTDQRAGANVLYLPTTLPDGVYFILTRRRLLLSDLPLIISAPQRILDLNDFHRESIEDIHLFLRQAAQRPGIESWFSARNLSLDNFVRALASKSECNFIYLHYVLAEMEQGAYLDVSLNQLPIGLDAYYEDHWTRMNVRVTPSSSHRLFILYVLCESLEPISRELLTDFAREGKPQLDEVAVQEVLNSWHQFLHIRVIDGISRYSIYHTSFREFLHRKDILSAAGVSLLRINKIIAANLSKAFPDEEDP